MTDLRKAAEMALEALEWNYGTDLENIENCTKWLDYLNKTIPALRQAIEQAEKREWVGLTYDEAYEFVCTTDSYKEFAQAIEAKLKEKNT